MDNRIFHIPMDFQPKHHLQVWSLVTAIIQNRIGLTESQIYNNILFAKMAGKITKGIREVGRG